MGKTQSKEEVIIAQAGNSGGVSASGAIGLTLFEVGAVVIVAFIIFGITFYCCHRAKKSLERKIRKEIARSLEDLA